MLNFENSEDYSSSDEEIRMQKFINITLPDNFDPTKYPQSGEEYIQHVIYEKKLCKSVVTANIDPKKLTKNQDYVLSGTNSENCEKCPPSMLPSLLWQKQKVKEFSEFRKYIEHQLKNKHDYQFDMRKVDTETEYPSFFYLAKCSIQKRLDILDTIIDKLRLIKAGDAIDDITSRWIFSILSVIDIPLFPSTHYTLRELAKQCARIRSKLPDNTSEKNYTNLNFFICIVSIYFNQLDLADNCS